MATFIADASSFVGTLAFDVGTVTTRAGFAGEDSPRVIYPSAVCAWRDGGSGDGDGKQRRGVLECDGHLNIDTLAHVDASPLQTASATDERVLRDLLDHGLHRLGCQNWAEHPVIMAEPTGSDAATRRRTAEFMFEEVGVPALCVARSAELVAISTSRPTAVVLEAGAETITASVVAEGAVVTRSVQTSAYGGVALARRLCDAVVQRADGQPLIPACSLRTQCTPSLHALRVDELSRAVCEKACRCIESRAESRALAKGKGSAAASKAREPLEYVLPDGRTVQLVEERTGAAERLFKPEAGGGSSHVSSMHALVLSAISAVEVELHKELLRNVVLTGGLACVPGLAERFEDEMRGAATSSNVSSILSHAHRLSIVPVSMHDRRHGAWVGGSILGSMGTHTQLWMSKAEYDEYGASLIGCKGLQHAW